MKRSPLIILAITLFLDLLGFGLILPLLPVYITHYGGHPWVGGALLACFSTMQFIFSPIWGQVSDRHGRRPLILMSLWGSAISFVAFGFAPNLLILFAARVAAGILSAASLPTAQAYIADVTPPEKRASGMAVLGASFGLGFALGPMIGGIAGRPVNVGFLHTTTLETPALLAAILCALNFLWAYFNLPESLPPKDRQSRKEGGRNVLAVFPAIAKALRNLDVSAQLTVFAFTTFAFTAVESTFSWMILLRFREVLAHSALTAWQHAHPTGVLTQQLQRDLIEKGQTGATSTVFTIVGLTLLLTQVLVMRGLARRVGENRLVMFGTALLTFSLIGIAFAPTLLAVQLLAVGIAMGNGVLNPSLNALITQAAGPKERGTLSGTQQGLGSLARIIAPPINNIIVDWKLGFVPLGAIPFLGSAALMATACVLSLRLKPLANQKAMFPEGIPDDLLKDKTSVSDLEIR